MEQIWKLVAEVLVKPGDMPSGFTRGFMNVMTWAESAESAGEKLARYIERFNWHVISIEDACAVTEGQEYGEQVEEMIERTRGNREAIILGIFHGYRGKVT